MKHSAKGMTAASMRRAVGPGEGTRRQEKRREPQFGKLLDQLDQDRLEARNRLLIGQAAFVRIAKSLDDQVDRPVVEMQPLAVLQPVRLRAVHHPAPFVGVRCNCASGGHGLPATASVRRVD